MCQVGLPKNHRFLGQRFVVRGSGSVTQQWNASVSSGEFTLLLDFELSSEIVNSLVLRGLRELRAMRNKAVILLEKYSRQRAN